MYETLIQPDELARLIEGGKVAIFDCSFDLSDPAAGREAWLASHVPMARYLHLDDDLAAPAGEGGRHPLPDRGRLASTLRDAGLGKGMQAVAYDRSGSPFAARLWWLLRWLGHDAVAVLDGGLAAWTSAGFPNRSGQEPAADPGDFVAAPRAAMPVVDATDVLANIAARRLRVIDARSPDRFAGHPNPLDPVAGHIPGARNRFYMDNLDAAGRFRPEEELADAFLEVIGDYPADGVIQQCGSGVTACHNLLAMKVAGLGESRLYPGSWSEWIADPARPVETGG